MNLVEYRIVETQRGQYDLVPCAPADEKYYLYDTVEETLKERRTLLEKQRIVENLVSAVECIKKEKQAHQSLAPSPPVKRVKHRR